MTADLTAADHQVLSPALHVRHTQLTNSLSTSQSSNPAETRLCGGKGRWGCPLQQPGSAMGRAGQVHHPEAGASTPPPPRPSQSLATLPSPGSPSARPSGRPHVPPARLSPPIPANTGSPALAVLRSLAADCHEGSGLTSAHRDRRARRFAG